jgi:hypothetical protein
MPLPAVKKAQKALTSAAVRRRASRHHQHDPANLGRQRQQTACLDKKAGFHQPLRRSEPTPVLAWVCVQRRKTRTGARTMRVLAARSPTQRRHRVERYQEGARQRQAGCPVAIMSQRCHAGSLSDCEVRRSPQRGAHGPRFDAPSTDRGPTLKAADLGRERPQCQGDAAEIERV